MIFNLTAKNCRISENWEIEIKKYSRKIMQFVPQIDFDLVFIDFVVRRNKPRGVYEGSLKLSLPIKNLYAKFQGYNPQECIQKSFERIINEIKKYKGRHISSDSTYPRRETIRKT